MVAKVIGYGPDRETARLRLIDALKETVLFGTANNKDFLIQCLEKQRFIDGAATTAFIAEEFSETDLAVAQPSVEDAAAAAVIDLNLEYQRHFARSTLSSHKLKNWTMASGLVSRKQYQFAESLYDLSISPLANSPDTYLVSCAQSQQQVEIQLLTLEGQSASLLVNDSTQLATFKLRRQGQLYCSIAGRSAMFKDQIILDGAVDEAVGGGRVVAPMHGLLLEVLVKPGDQVLKGQNLAVLEAMKMHYEIIAEVDGTVEEVTAVAGNQVAADDVLIEIQQEEAH
ncbi:MAG: 3-methylcrotonyl-CoA carboxylase, partial [Porticoccaceae bacterium]|nr:3-methylcrotonyl-CoA carboxylase [Porticoccaceae bacterium]